MLLLFCVTDTSACRISVDTGMQDNFAKARPICPMEGQYGTLKIAALLLWSSHLYEETT